jgi:hypothetical protein
MANPSVQDLYDPVTYRSGTKAGVTTVQFSSNLPHRAPLLCYIAGIECPIISATVSYGVKKIPEANISMFPDPQLQRFGAEDRVPMVLFYLDEYIDPERPAWRLMFEGEIVGWGWTNSPLGRSIQFSCVSDIAIYTQLFFFYMTSLSSLAQGHLTAKQTGEQINQATAVYPYALFKKGLIQSGNQDYIKRPFDFAYNVLRGLISTEVDKKLLSVPGVNFFTRWVRRQQFHNKWVALPYLDAVTGKDGKDLPDQPPGIFPVLRAAQSSQAVEALEKHIGGQGGGGSIWSMLNSVLEVVFMELAMLPTAPAVAASVSEGTILGKPEIVAPSGIHMPEADYEHISGEVLDEVRLKEGGISTADIKKVLGDNVGNYKKNTRPIRLVNYFLKPQFLFGLPPACNVIFPSMIQQGGFQENYITQPTRLYFQDDTLANLVPMQGKGNENLKTYLMTVLARAFPPEADNKFQDSVKGKGTNETGKNLLIWPEEFFKGPVTARYPAPPWLMYLASYYQTQSKKSGAKGSKTVTPSEGDVLTDEDLYRLYAEYEYWRHRYSKRQGTEQLAFHPYLVPGFPVMLFDDFQSALHVIGYLMNVTQSFSSGNVATNINYTYGRTLQEFFDNIAEQMDDPAVESRKGLATAAAPPEPIPEIRDVIQHFSKADTFYKNLLYRRIDTPNKDHVFEYRNLLSFVKADGSTESITIEGLNEETLAQTKTDLSKHKKVVQNILDKNASDLIKRFIELRENKPPLALTQDNTQVTGLGEAFDVAGIEFSVTDLDGLLRILKETLTLIEALEKGLTNPKVTHNLGGTQKQIVPKPGKEDLFDNYDAAMKYAARPICTLEEYIGFINGVREGINDDFTYEDGKKIPSARYYTRIRRMTEATTNTKATEEQEGLKGKAPAAVPSSFPQLRAEWSKSLLAYRANVYSRTRVSR